MGILLEYYFSPLSEFLRDGEYDENICVCWGLSERGMFGEPLFIVRPNCHRYILRMDMFAYS